MSDDTTPTDESPEPSDDEHEIRATIDDLADAPSGRPRPARTEELPDGVRERIEAEIEDTAYVQHEYATDAHHICRVGLRRQGRIEDVIVAVGEGGVARHDEIADVVDELRRGRSPDEVDRLLG